MATNASALVERLETDPAFAKSVQSAGSKEDKKAIIKAAGFDLSAEDIKALKTSSELSDADLEKVSGGIGTSTGVKIGVTAASAVCF